MGGGAGITVTELLASHWAGTECAQLLVLTLGLYPRCACQQIDSRKPWSTHQPKLMEPPHPAPGHGEKGIGSMHGCKQT